MHRVDPAVCTLSRNVGVELCLRPQPRASCQCCHANAPGPLLSSIWTRPLQVLRFANLLFEPLWNRKYIRNVQVSTPLKYSLCMHDTLCIPQTPTPGNCFYNLFGDLPCRHTAHLSFANYKSHISFCLLCSTTDAYFVAPQP